MKKTPKTLLTTSALIAGLAGFSSIAQAAINTFDGSTNQNWTETTNWSLGTLPTTVSDSLIFTQTSGDVYMAGTQWTLGNSQTATASNITDSAFRIGGSDSLTIATGSSWDTTGGAGNFAIAQNSGGGDIILEADATFKVDRIFTDTQTWTFKADTDSVTTVEVSNLFFANNGGNTNLTVDLTNYNIASGASLTLFTAGFYDGTAFAGTTQILGDFTGDFAYESGVIRLDNITVVPEPSSYALIGGLLALGSVMVRRRS